MGNVGPVGDMRMRRLLTPLVLCALLLAAAAPCSAKPYRPLVFVPGILGSVLEADGQIVWGDQQSLFRFSQLALPVDGAPSRNIRATRPIGTIAVLGAFKIRQYDLLYSTLKEIGFTEGVNLFSFAYDWRRSNFENAAALERFVQSTPALQGEFDIVAHSMGGLITRILVQDHGPGSRVRTVLNLGVPFQGSASSIKTIEEGWGVAANVMAGGTLAVRDVVLSFPSIYELLPRYAECCISGVPGAGQPFNILTDAFWSRYPGLPARFRTPQGQAYLRAQLANARKLQGLMAKSVPPHVSERYIVGDLKDTVSRVYFDTNAGSAQTWQNESGDGTVVLLSAANGQLPRTDPAFVGHQIIFSDDYVKVLLKRALDSDAGRFRPYSAPVPVIRRRDGAKAEIEGLNVEVPPVLQPGGTAEVAIQLRTKQPVRRGDVELSASIGDDRNYTLDLTLTETTAEEDSRRASFRATFPVPTDSGTYMITTVVRGIGTYDDYFVVAPK